MTNQKIAKHLLKIAQNLVSVTVDDIRGLSHFQRVDKVEENELYYADDQFYILSNGKDVWESGDTLPKDAEAEWQKVTGKSIKLTREEDGGKWKLSTDYSKCKICGGEVISTCRCPSFVKHDLESLKNGHGKLCENGHRFSWDCDDYLYVPELVQRKKNLKKLLAMEFDTKEQMNDYLKNHPDADKSKHTVKPKKKNFLNKLKDNVGNKFHNISLKHRFTDKLFSDEDKVEELENNGIFIDGKNISVDIENTDGDYDRENVNYENPESNSDQVKDKLKNVNLWNDIVDLSKKLK